MTDMPNDITGAVVAMMAQMVAVAGCSAATGGHRGRSQHRAAAACWAAQPGRSGEQASRVVILSAANARCPAVRLGRPSAVPRQP
jgi:hypothetical protein